MLTNILLQSEDISSTVVIQLIKKQIYQGQTSVSQLSCMHTWCADNSHTVLHDDVPTRVVTDTITWYNPENETELINEWNI